MGYEEPSAGADGSGEGSSLVDIEGRSDRFLQQPLWILFWALRAKREGCLPAEETENGEYRS